MLYLKIILVVVVALLVAAIYFKNIRSELEWEVIAMSESFLIPLEVYGLGIVISLGIAMLIKFMMTIIRKFSKDEPENKAEES